MAIAAAFNGVYAVFKDVNNVEPELRFAVLVWKELNGSVVGLIVVPGHPELYQPPHAPVPSNYCFNGYQYFCPQ